MSERELRSWLIAEAANMCTGNSTYLAILNQCRRDVEQAMAKARSRL